MLKNENVQVLYEGDFIRVGVSKKTGKTYIHVIEDTNLPALWFRFEPEYYADYEDYIKEYRACLNAQRTYPQLGCHKILNGPTLDHYIALFDPKEVYINDTCVYSTTHDVSYTKDKFAQDIAIHMVPNLYYPFINNVDIRFDDKTKETTIHFTITIKYEEL